jgi:hypothetical protein
MYKRKQNRPFGENARLLSASKGCFLFSEGCSVSNFLPLLLFFTLSKRTEVTQSSFVTVARKVDVFAGKL